MCEQHNYVTYSKEIDKSVDVSCSCEDSEEKKSCGVAWTSCQVECSLELNEYSCFNISYLDGTFMNDVMIPSWRVGQKPEKRVNS